ncbi:hypothetical protein GCM10025880_31910 [Methylorubrum aminovorans]|uniref:hypothetical protein n=1 Tax=Methylorubrum aminovorans TaxID=269069 RepID=UPI0023E9717F|nr:hypothetical protein [Methylorubrum aminovorans]GMA76774.1 hypothetical protein GCM10025880_31910 [Methylorubrum aminovorans]
MKYVAIAAAILFALPLAAQAQEPKPVAPEAGATAPEGLRRRRRPPRSASRRMP